MLTLFVISDATGETVERMARSALVQFEGAEVQVVRRAEITTAEQVRAVLEEAAAGDSIVVYTLVSDDLRRLMLAEARRRGVDCLDVLGPLLERLAIHLRLSSRQKPGLFKQLSEAKTREIRAVAFAFKHDDGQNVEELHRAEVLLVGPSRSMKTPVMLYLAYRGWLAANVPLVPELALPKPLLSVPARRVFCLVLQPEELRRRRLVRATEEAIPREPYASLPQIRKECQYAQWLCREHGWRQIDVTGKAVEEVAREIIALLRENE
jgi:hypothetical protein